MFDSIYIGLTGLKAFSKDLTVIGNNVANLNTPGFKGSQLLFSDLFYRTQFSDNNAIGANVRLDIGNGVGTNATRFVFTQGELKQTGNDQDAAISGNGFFVVRKGDQTFYTRAGQFNFDADGFLVSSSGGARVAALVNGQLQDINILGMRTNAGRATTRVEFSGILDSNASSASPYTISNISAFDANGITHQLSAVFTNNSVITPGSWLVDVKDESGTVVATGEIRFNSDGTPAIAFNSFDVTIGSGDATQSVQLFFGDPGSVSGARSLSASSSSLAVSQQDGFGAGSLTRASFDSNGTLVLLYSNGQTINGDTLALASFSFLQGLREIEGNLFVPGQGQEKPVLGLAGKDTFGSVTGGSIELANVDLAQQFSDLIISQRGYQASSQVISTANDMIQQLYDMKSKR
jgi:flagellar hook protein FlgE